MNLMKLAMVLLMGGVVGGCVVPDDDNSLEARCERRKDACVNSCFKAGQGAACRECCRESGKACKNDESFSFYDCPDKDDPR